jgi:hypothetical protein
MNSSFSGAATAASAIALSVAGIHLATAQNTGASACTGPQINLQQSSTSWQTNQDATMSFTGGSIQLSAGKGGAASAVLQAGFFDAADACVDIVTPSPLTDPNAAVAGIEFGVNQQSGEYYAFVIVAAGSAGVMHHQTRTGNDISVLVPFAAARTVKTDPNATNTLHLTWKGTNATAYINDQQFAAFSIPTLQNTLFGLYVQGDGSKTGAATWNFTNLQLGNSP